MLDDRKTPKIQLLKRLRSYWKLECLNIFLLPFMAIIVVVFGFHGTFTLAFGFSLLATSWLLVVGTISLRMMLSDLERNFSYSVFWLPKLCFAQLPSLGLVFASLLLTTQDCIGVFPDFAASQYGSIVFTTLAVLEYINYYHWQLQHFDNASDFSRLIKGDGFRKSHLARALERWRKSG